MSNPGTKTPPSRFPKSGEYGTALPQAAGSKQLKCDHLDLLRGQVAELKSDNGPTAPATRVYSRDYSKTDPDGDQGDDTLSPFLGRPIFRL
ncbi:MAG TPA: hypothetical protein VN734_17145 [Acidobacteriaceae bacterium]|nr:hypothetical protein [Acidobacteriaceae bacterium]